MKRYLYKNIVLKKVMGSWCAYYKDENNMFLLCACGCKKKPTAYAIAKNEVDGLNERKEE